MTTLHWFAPDEDLGDELVVGGKLADTVTALARELRATDRFLRCGVDPPTRVLFSGPSGTGKTLAARWLGWSLKAHVAVVDVAEVIGSHLGETARKLPEATTRRNVESAQGILRLLEGADRAS